MTESLTTDIRLVLASLNGGLDSLLDCAEKMGMTKSLAIRRILWLKTKAPREYLAQLASCTAEWHAAIEQLVDQTVENFGMMA